MVDITVYQYCKMRGATSTIGREMIDKELQLGEASFTALSYYNSHNERALEEQEIDHTASVGSFQNSISISTDDIPVDLYNLNMFLNLITDECNSEQNTELVSTAWNSVRMIIVHMMMNGLDAVKIASLVSSFQKDPYKHTTTFGSIIIMSDNVLVGGDDLFFEIFAELSLLCK